MNAAIIRALTGYLPLILPVAVLGVVACVLFLGGTWRAGRNLWGGAALIGLGLAAVALFYSATELPTVEELDEGAKVIDRLAKALVSEPTLPRRDVDAFARIKGVDPQLKELVQKPDLTPEDRNAVLAMHHALLTRYRRKTPKQGIG